MRPVWVSLVALVSLSTGAPAQKAPVPTAVTLVRHFTPAHQVSGRYQYVPFDVPPGASALRISYQYDRANGDNVIDLGLFEPGPLDLGTRAFRGYSGGARTGITISASETTPGYRPGLLPAGQWHVLLGLYKVGPAGVAVNIHAEMELKSLAPRADETHRPASTQRAQQREQPKWYLGALHTHTLHSDGTVTPAKLIGMMRTARFDFVAITDHNNTTHQYELASQYSAGADPLWIIGEEVTTPGGHASVWGLHDDEWIDFRVSPGDGRIGDLVAAAQRYGAIFSVNHPASECLACGWTHEFVKGIEGIEISNGRHGEIDKALAIWDGLLRAGRRITGVGSSDWHSAPNAIDDANVRVYASSLSEDAILDAIRKGRVIIMRNARDATPSIRFRSGAHVAMVGESLPAAAGARLTIEVDAPALAGAQVIVVADGQRETPVSLGPAGQAYLERRAAPGFVRLEFRGADGVPLAITNPVYVVRP